MRIIDIHAHIYPTVAGITKGQPMVSQRLGRVKVGNEIVQFLPPSFEQTNSTPDTLVAYMDWCGIEKAILMPNPYYGYHNDYLLQAVSQYPGRLRAAALVNLLGGQAAADELARIYEQTPLFGFKVETNSTFQCAPDKRMTDADLSPVWECCETFGQPVFIHPFRACDLEDIRALAERYQKITFVVCHMGADACFAKGARAGAFDELLALLARLPNLYIDTSTVPVYFQEEYPFRSAVAVIEKAYLALGPEKLMWASDYPGMLCHATMRQLVNLVANGCTQIPAHHLELIMGENAHRLFFTGQD